MKRAAIKRHGEIVAYYGGRSLLVCLLITSLLVVLTVGVSVARRIITGGAITANYRSVMNHPDIRSTLHGKVENHHDDGMNNFLSPQSKAKFADWLDQEERYHYHWYIVTSNTQALELREKSALRALSFGPEAPPAYRPMNEGHYPPPSVPPLHAYAAPPSLMHPAYQPLDGEYPMPNPVSHPPMYAPPHWAHQVPGHGLTPGHGLSPAQSHFANQLMAQGSPYINPLVPVMAAQNHPAALHDHDHPAALHDHEHPAAASHDHEHPAAASHDHEHPAAASHDHDHERVDGAEAKSHAATKTMEDHKKHMREMLAQAQISEERVLEIASLKEAKSAMRCSSVIYTAIFMDTMVERPQIIEMYRHMTEWNERHPDECLFVLFPLIRPQGAKNLAYLKYKAGMYIMSLLANDVIVPTMKSWTVGDEPLWIGYFDPMTYFSNVDMSFQRLMAKIKMMTPHHNDLHASSNPKFLNVSGGLRSRGVPRSDRVEINGGSPEGPFNAPSVSTGRRLGIWSLIKSRLGFGTTGEDADPPLIVDEDTGHHIIVPKIESLVGKHRLPFHAEHDKNSIEWKMCHEADSSLLSCDGVVRTPPMHKLGMIFGTTPACGQTAVHHLTTTAFLFRPSLLSAFILSSIYEIHAQQVRNSPDYSNVIINDALLLGVVLERLAGLPRPDLGHLCNARLDGYKGRRRWYDACAANPSRFVATRLIDMRRLTYDTRSDAEYMLEPQEIDPEAEELDRAEHIYRHQRTLPGHHQLEQSDAAVMEKEADYWFDKPAALFSHGLLASTSHIIEGPQYVAFMCGRALSASACRRDLTRTGGSYEVSAWRCGDFSANFHMCSRRGFYQSDFRKKMTESSECARMISLKTNTDPSSHFDVNTFLSEVHR